MLSHSITPNDSLNLQNEDTNFELKKEIIITDKVNMQSAFSFFLCPIKNIKPEKDINLLDAYNLIISEKYRANTNELRSIEDLESSKEFKCSKFDYVTFNGTFKERSDKKLINLSGLFIIDIDDLGEKLQLVKDRLIKDNILYPQLVFTSPSGNGLKIVVRIDPSIITVTNSNKIMNNIWQSINSHFGNQYGDLITANEKNHYIDGACKDLSRGCFLCHDPDAYFFLNENNILDESFIASNASIEKGGSEIDFIGETRNIQSNKLKSGKSLKNLATRHLMKRDNHHNDLLSFVGAAKKYGIIKLDLEKYIKNYVHISEASNHANYKNVKILIDDIYERYNTDSEGVQNLNPLSFSYQFLIFRLSPIVKQFIASSLFMDEVINILHQGGFMKRNLGDGYIYIQKKGKIIKVVSPENMRDYMTNYINSIEKDFSFSFSEKDYLVPVAAIREIYFKNSNNIFNSTWLQHLNIDTEPILKDKKQEMYYTFNNSIVVVTADGISVKSFNDIPGYCVWDDQMVHHDFIINEDFLKSHFYEFLINITNGEKERLLSMQTGIGYLLHHFFNPTEGKAVLFYDEALTDTKNQMGGTGKGIVIKAIGNLRKVTKIDGKNVDPGNRFRWELINQSTQVVCIDDIKPTFDFNTLFSNLTEGWTIEGKHRPQYMIEPKDSPKTVICSNSCIQGYGNSIKRRKFEIEFSDFYSSQIKLGLENPIVNTHGCQFFSDDWSPFEWNMFYNVLLNCANLYLRHGLQHYKGINIERNRLLQATNEYFVIWVENQNFELNKLNDTKINYNDFITSFEAESIQLEQRTFTEWLKIFANSNGWMMMIKQSNGISFFKFTSV